MSTRQVFIELDTRARLASLTIGPTTNALSLDLLPSLYTQILLRAHRRAILLSFHIVKYVHSAIGRSMMVYLVAACNLFGLLDAVV